MYDLLDHFCEFIVIHLSYIRKHKYAFVPANESPSFILLQNYKCNAHKIGTPDVTCILDMYLSGSQFRVIGLLFSVRRCLSEFDSVFIMGHWHCIMICMVVVSGTVLMISMRQCQVLYLHQQDVGICLSFWWYGSSLESVMARGSRWLLSSYFPGISLTGRSPIFTFNVQILASFFPHVGYSYELQLQLMYLWLQIKENLSIKSVPNDVKYKLVDEIARSCLEPGPLAIEYYSELQLDQVTLALFLD